MKKIKVIGQMDNADGTFESINRVYDTEGIAPTIPTCGGAIHNRKFYAELLEDYQTK